jgi:hypothetical protein
MPDPLEQEISILNSALNDTTHTIDVLNQVMRKVGSIDLVSAMKLQDTVKSLRSSQSIFETKLNLLQNLRRHQ